MRGESCINLLDRLRVLARVLLLYGPGTEAVRTEAVEDWHVESAHSRHLWVNVQRVPVSAQPVEDGLIALRLLLLDKIWLSIGRLWDVGLDGTLVTEASNTAHEKRGPDS